MEVGVRNGGLCCLGIAPIFGGNTTKCDRPISVVLSPCVTRLGHPLRVPYVFA